MESMSWRRIGFERRPDGTEDRTRPLFVMSNPNAVLDQIKIQ